jgi:hypothetical protein
VLELLLDPSPLTRERALAILDILARVVADFRALFGEHEPDECALLAAIHADLDRSVREGLERERDAPELSSELTRRVRMFDDPPNPGAIATMHGLKRYLHQRGLSLGFRLVRSGGAPDRTVDLVAVTRDRVSPVVRRIRYADFEPRGDDDTRVPPAVSAAVESFARQLLEGNHRLPSLDVFCYGNEVHYNLGFRNHPALLRIDWAPPPWGGMVDLEYIGVSNYEVDRHPEPGLDAMRRMLRELGMDVRGEGSRIHARYDKERASDPSALTAKAETVLRLAPYLMDVDWTIGALPLDDEARRRVAATWTRTFARWGALPFDRLLTRDRRTVLERTEAGPLGEREVAWNGVGPCPDGPAAPLPESAFRAALERVRALGVETPPAAEGAGGRGFGQTRLEAEILRPLRRAIARGQVTVSGGKLEAAPPSRFRREHEAERFARILAAGGGEAERAAAIAAGIAPLERIVRFRTTGTVDGREVQRARLDCAGETLGIFVLRDELGIARLAELTRDEILRAPPGGSAGDAAAPPSAAPGADLAAVLRRLDCPVSAAAAASEDTAASAHEVLAALRVPPAPAASSPVPGERVVPGTASSPGRATGPLRLARPGRSPRDFEGSVLAAPTVSPADNAAIYRAGGVVSTGGAVLSHAGMIARQFGKPALLVDGRWREEGDGPGAGPPALILTTEDYREEEREVAGRPVRIRRDVVERELELRDGDLVVLDADEATLRVLGSDPEALALHESLRAFARADLRLARARGGPEVLALRGDRLRARRRLEQQLARVRDPGVARHAVHEILLGDTVSAGPAGCEERARLLSPLLADPAVGVVTRACVRDAVRRLSRRFESARDRAAGRIPSAGECEVLALRARARETAAALESARETLRRCGVPPGVEAPAADRLDAPAVRRLRELRAGLASEVMRAASHRGDARLRHLLRRVDRVDDVLGTPPAERARLAGPRLALEVADHASRGGVAGRRIVRPGEAGLELAAEIGWKAANLAEIARLAGEAAVPSWFAVADAAFQEVMEGPASEPRAPAGTLGAAIDRVLRDRGATDAVRSARVRALWEGVRLPGALVRDVMEAYEELGGDEVHVAVRSSTREEDAETAARAGEFDTFLCVRGRMAVLQHLKRAWAGFWTERAIHNRGVLGATAPVGCGVIVQRMIPARVAGVAQTVNTATGNLREIIVNAGFGLGEGIVSGRVAADRIAVAKEGDPSRGPLRFRCVTADKTEQVVLNRLAGIGTVRVPTLSHQRLRPALDYLELAELVRAALFLEDAYGHPLDLEFAFEGTRLWLLQARPVAALDRVLRDSLDRHPLEGVPASREAAA